VCVCGGACSWCEQGNEQSVRGLHASRSRSLLVYEALKLLVYEALKLLVYEAYKASAGFTPPDLGPFTCITPSLLHALVALFTCSSRYMF